MKIEIKNRWTGEVIFGGEYPNIKAAMAAALGMKVSLRCSNLSGSDLSGSDLSGSDLSRSNLSGSNLSGSNLSGSNLSGSNLSGSNLSGSNLSGSNLSGSDLSRSNLSRSNLSGSNLSGSNLSGSNLSGSNLSGSDLSRSNLSPVRSDFLAEVLNLPNELEFLRDALMAGKVDGSTYSGECACLAGTLAHAKGLDSYHGGDITNGRTFVSDFSSPRERFFLAIRKGDTPENNGACKIALAWTNEAIAIRDNIRATAKTEVQP